MHHIHRTRAFVLKNVPTKETDTQITLLTEDLGVIKAIAQGSRKMESKMRQSIQDYSLSHIALVSGRTGWRLVNAIFIKNFSFDLKSAPLKQSFYKIFGLIDRLIVDELEDRDIFEIVLEFIDFASANDDALMTDDTILSFESIFLARILHNLGYIGETKMSKYIDNPISLNLIESLTKGDGIDRRDFIKELNQAVRASDL